MIKVACPFPASSKGTACPDCGYVLKRDYDSIPRRRCGSPPPVETNHGLGDQVESLLASIGVTPDRYIAAKEFCGLPPTCGCKSRKEWLNNVSDWWRGENKES
jgi:hypothetical protein